MQPTLGEMVEMFLAANGVDLTSLKARAKIIEDEEAQLIGAANELEEG